IARFRPEGPSLPPGVPLPTTGRLSPEACSLRPADTEAAEAAISVGSEAKRRGSGGLQRGSCSAAPPPHPLGGELCFPMREDPPHFGTGSVREVLLPCGDTNAETGARP